MPLSPFFGFERDPFAVMRRLQEEVDRASTSPTRAAGGFPAVNIWQGTDSAALTAELPGVDPADIDISVKEEVITITGERKAPATDDQTVWNRRERPYGRFSRVIQLPFKVDPDRVEARLQDGVLQIELHRPEADKPRRVQINAA
jgi:HSP20 family protein